MPHGQLRLIYQNENFDNELLQNATRLAAEGRHRAALPLLKQLVDNGETVANCYLGLIYEYGYTDVPANYEFARFYYERALEDGWVPGCIGLGRIYYYGLDVEKNLPLAFDYFMRIHDAGITSPIADFYVGQMLLIGDGVQKDVDRSLFFLERSAREGYLWAFSRLAKIAYARRKYVAWIFIRLKLIAATTMTIAKHGTKSWHTALPTSTMGPQR